jgi:putative endopeptidase
MVAAVAFVLTVLAGCAGAPEAPVAPPPTPAPPHPRTGIGVRAFSAEFRSLRAPQDDLYRFANGTWLKQTEIPADRAEYGKFGVLQVGRSKA